MLFCSNETTTITTTTTFFFVEHQRYTAEALLKKAILPLSLIQEEQLTVIGESYW